MEKINETPTSPVSKHWADVILWIEKNIESCKTREQRQVCEKLIDNFTKLYKDKKNMTHEVKMKLWMLK